MGAVFRGLDEETGHPVAIKHLLPGAVHHLARFEREIAILRELSHPGIVRYVAHGRASVPAAGSVLTRGDELVLVLEWLEGESLGKRLRRGGLGVAEAVDLVRRVATALGEAHRHNIVHRDLKPSNVLLEACDAARPKVLDFGIARRASLGEELTQAGVVLGTPGYMAPEQVRGDGRIDHRADVFALGCLLFTCLTGRRPFGGGDDVATLLRLLLEPAPSLLSLRPDLSPELDRLLMRLLAPDPAARPDDGHAVAREIERLGPLEGDAPEPSAAAGPGLTVTERRVVSVVLAELELVSADDLATMQLDHAHLPSAPGFEEATLVDAPVPLDVAVRRLATAFEARFEVLAGNVAVLSLSAGGAATDLAGKAATLAIALRDLAEDAPMAIATGWAEGGLRTEANEVVERAWASLRRARQRPTPLRAPWPSAAPSLPRTPCKAATRRAAACRRPIPARAAALKRARRLRARPVVLDRVTSGLLSHPFELAETPDGAELVGERSRAPIRTLLGKSTPCVGRERELATLRATLDQSVLESCARAVLVTAPAGAGKSRLRFEFTRGVERGDAGPVSVWIARGDPLSRGAPYGVLAGALRGALGVHVGDAPEHQRKRLVSELERLGVADARHVAEVLAHALGLPPSEPRGPALAAAFADRAAMSDQLRAAWLALFDALTRGGTLLVLEDLHWGDASTARLVDAALDRFAERPFMVLALARPEVSEAFPSLFEGRDLHEIRLPPLPKRAAERLVREAHGAEHGDALAASLAQRSQGNAFYLEELIRSVAQGRGDELPETVLAMAQARLDEIDADGRRILRAASVLGPVFWRGAVLHLLGGPERAPDIDRWLAHLSEREILSPRAASRFDAEDEYVFRHALLADAAYAMLTDGDKRLGHGLAAEWLEQAGEPQAAVIAEHVFRGAAPAASVPWFQRAAHQALEGGDWEGAVQRARRGAQCGAEGEALAQLSLCEAIAHRFLADQPAALAASQRALALAQPMGSTWAAAAAEAVGASSRLGDKETLRVVSDRLFDAHTAGARDRSMVFGLASATVQLLHHGERALAECAFSAVEELEAEGLDEHGRGWVSRARGYVGLHRGDRALYLRATREAMELLERAGDHRVSVGLRSAVGFAELTLGRPEAAERELLAAIDAAKRMGIATTVTVAKHNLGLAVALQGRLAEGRALEHESIAECLRQKDRRIEVGARGYLARIELLAGEACAAEREAKRALEVATSSSEAYARAVLSLALLAQGRSDEALAEARAAERAQASGGGEEGEALVALCLVRALAARGEHTLAQTTRERARARLVEQAANIDDPALSQTFLVGIPEHVELLRGP